jgi:putative IMPACT (imprinted ancient) family translation regulator
LTDSIYTENLVKAYGDSVKEVLKLVKTEPLIEKSKFSMTIPYNLYDLLKKYLSEVQATIEHEEFSTEVTLQGSLPSEGKEALASYLTECSNGSCSVQFTGE